MSIINKYIPFHFLIGLLVGVLIQFYTGFWEFGFTNILLVLTTLFISLLLIYWKKKIFWFSIISYIIFIFIGVSSTFVNNPTNYENHFSKSNDKSLIILEISKILKPNTYNLRYEADVIQVNNKKTKGKILLNIKRDSTLNTPNIGEKLLTFNNYKPIPPSKNPYEFDYSKYLEKRYINHKITIKKESYISLKSINKSPLTTIQNFRYKIQESLQKQKFSAEVYSITNALLLGDKTFISKEIKESYINAGVIHILAISGLHIGIILYILMIILKPIDKIKYGKIIKSVIIILLLWSFAILSGMSASVVRAVTMFSFITVGISMDRRTYVEHSLISSMLFLLLIKPLFIFDVGFQLSYLAVFGIIWIRPLLFKIYHPKQKVILFFWNLITVSIAAQIAVMPISFYYFHQFSSLFLISNVVIIPCLTFILGLGIIVIITSILKFQFTFLFALYEWIITLLNKYIQVIADFEHFLIKDISMSFLEMISWYLLIFFGYKLATSFTPKHSIAFLSSLLILQISYFITKNQIYGSGEFIIFQKNKSTIISIRESRRLIILSNTNRANEINNYKIAKHISSISKKEIPNILKYKKETFLIIDSISVYTESNIKEPVIILRNSPRINLNRLISSLQPKEIIADGSNYKSYVKMWRETCNNKKIPFHSTYENGSYIINSK